MVELLFAIFMIIFIMLNIWVTNDVIKDRNTYLTNIDKFLLIIQKLTFFVALYGLTMINK